MPKDCFQEQAGHSFYVTCGFTVAYEVEYEVPQLPVYLYCSFYWDAVEVTELLEPSDTISGQLTAREYTMIYRDGNSDGAVDEALPLEEDGIYVDLRCVVSPLDDPSLAVFEEYQYAAVSCYRPIHDAYAREVCTAPFLPFSETHE